MDRTDGSALAPSPGSETAGYRVNKGNSDPGERRLIERARGGDVEAFESLYRTYAGRVYAVCRRFAGDESRAEDCTQEVFLRLWQRLDSFQGQSAFFSWLYRMTVNICIDHTRAEARRGGRVSGDELLDTLPEPRPVSNPAGKLDLESGIDALPPGARTVFVLHDVEGYRHEDIANMTGLASGTCRAQLHRARRLLREWLGS